MDFVRTKLSLPSPKRILKLHHSIDIVIHNKYRKIKKTNYFIIINTLHHFVQNMIQLLKSLILIKENKYRNYFI